MSFEYLVNVVTSVPAGGDFCAIDGNRDDPDQVWVTRGRQTTISLKGQGAPEHEDNDEEIPRWRVVAEEDARQWKFTFDGMFMCGPSAVHAIDIAIRKKGKRCVLINVAD